MVRLGGVPFPGVPGVRLDEAGLWRPFSLEGAAGECCKARQVAQSVLRTGLGAPFGTSEGSCGGGVLLFSLVPQQAAVNEVAVWEVLPAVPKLELEPGALGSISRS